MKLLFTISNIMVYWLPKDFTQCTGLTELDDNYYRIYVRHKKTTYISIEIMLRNLFLLSISALFFLIVSVSNGSAASAEQIDIEIDAALTDFSKEIKGGEVFLEKSKGVLVFPSVIKAGFVVGGEYGEGALRIKNKTVQYYSTASASLGFQRSTQKKLIVMVFLKDQALADFQTSEGWEAGVDGSVALVEWGVGEDLSTTEFDQPIIAFIFNNAGLMYNLTIEGTKFTKIVR